MAAEPKIKEGVNLAPYIEKLHAEYDRVRQALASLEGSGLHDSLLEDTGEISSYDNHPADEGTEVFMRERDQVLEDNLENILRQCERALQKVEEGTYGYSDVSGEFIGEERLDAVPYAALTIEEQERTVQG